MAKLFIIECLYQFRNANTYVNKLKGRVMRTKGLDETVLIRLGNRVQVYSPIFLIHEERKLLFNLFS